MMASTSFFLFVALCSVVSVHGQNSTNSTGGLSFRGTGYIACDVADFRPKPCNFTLDLVNCTEDQIMQECNASLLGVVTANIDFTTAYVPLVCDCLVWENCPASCEQFSGDVPTLPPVALTANFSGVGTVICPIISFVEVEDDSEACYPTVIDNSTCGTCDFEAALAFDDDLFGFMDGDTTITIPLTCECIKMFNCPDTCTFNATDAAPTTDETETPAAAPAGTPAAPAGTPAAAPAGTPAAPTTEETPAAAPVRSPTAPAAAPVRSPTAAAPSTSAAFATTIHTYKCFAVMTVFALVSIVML